MRIRQRKDLTATAQCSRSLQIRAALLLVCISAGLVGFAVGGWLSSGRLSGVDVAGMGGLRPTAVMIFLATLMTLSAATLWLRARGVPADTATRDQATGLYNRIYLDEVVPGLMARDDRAGCSQLALVLLRVDFLDDIRQRNGSPAADRVLAVMGRQVRSQTRAGDVPARFDEQGLAIFLQCGEVDQAIAFGRRLTTLLAGEQLELRGDVIKITASMGVAVRQLGESLDALQARAAHKLALARDAGPSQIVG